jgi:hypothetical protein
MIFFSVFQSCKPRMHKFFPLVLISNSQFVNSNDSIYIFCIIVWPFPFKWILIDGVKKRKYWNKREKTVLKFNWINTIRAYIF